MGESSKEEGSEGSKLEGRGVDKKMERGSGKEGEGPVERKAEESKMGRG